MPLSTRAELIASAKNWLEGEQFQDGTIDRVGDFITLLESRMNREIATREMETNYPLTLTVGSKGPYSIPADWLEPRTFRINQAEPAIARTLEYRPPDQFWAQRMQVSLNSEPKTYTVEGLELYVAPAPDSAYVVNIPYVQKIPALTATNTSNWLLSKAPDVYLYGILLEAAIFVQDPEHSAVYAALYERARKSLQGQDSRSRMRPGARIRLS